MNVRVGAVAALASSCLVTTPARAQGDRWQRHVRRQLERAAALLSAPGTVKPPAIHVAALNTDESDSFTLTLHEGMQYTALGVCDEDCDKLALVISDLKSHELAADRASDNAPVVRLTPQETVLYRVKVVMERCRLNPCRYGVAVLGPCPKGPARPCGTRL